MLFVFMILKNLFLKLSHLVYCLAQTGNLSCCIVLVVNTLCCSHLDGLGSSSQFSSSGSLVTGFDYSVYLLDSGLYAGFDSLISISLCAVY